MIIAKDLHEERMKIDLDGPEGNAYVLLGLAKSFGKQLKYSHEDISFLIEDMTGSDYAHLVRTFDMHFGDYVMLYNASIAGVHI